MIVANGKNNNCIRRKYVVHLLRVSAEISITPKILRK
jgi:hypothetical protein